MDDDKQKTRKIKTPYPALSWLTTTELKEEESKE
jgi:hypothetical protein